MPGFWARLAITALGLLLAQWLVDGIEISGVLSLLLASLVLGFINALVRPLLIILTLPFTLLTLGLFLLVINAAMLALAAFFVPGFTVVDFWDAVLGSLIVSLIGALASWYIGPRGSVEVVVIERHRR
ncbi:phage holin family protein [Marinobacterium arenosum]|uniref:phage holin family protein n=1 Tax=Marinobacterium arenosum TaxID=2862496 RepID=UPI001C95F5C7|nr:phage holin family protein [Marinobacterium arenosum]MBY4679093.1 phage holin family protein [Marinobacterium arenosum]